MAAVTSAAAEPASRDLSRLARGSALNLAGSVVNAVANFALIVVITRGLGRGRAGAFLEATAMFQILATAGQLGADTGLARFLPAALVGGRRGDLRHWTRVAFVPVLVVGVVTGAVAWACADALGPVVAGSSHGADFTDAFRVLALFVPVGAAYFVLQTATRAFGTMVPSVAVERVGRAVTQPLVVLAAVAAGVGPAGLALAWIGPYAIAAVPLALWYLILVRRAERRPDRAPPPPSGTAPPSSRGFWSFATPRAVAGVFQVAILWLDVLLVGALAGPADAAVYSASSRWLVVGLFVALAVNQAFQPQISAMLAAGASDRAEALFRASTAWVVAFVWPIYLTLAVFGGVLVGVFGRGYEEGATVLVILAVAGLIGSASGPVDMVLLMGGRSRNNLVNTAAALAVNVVANVALVPRMGVAGAAVAWALSIAVANGLALVQVRRGVGITPFGPALARVAPGTVVSVLVPLGVARATLGATVAGLVVGLAAAAALHVALLWRCADSLDAGALRKALRGRRGGPGKAPDPVVPSAVVAGPALPPPAPEAVESVEVQR